MRGEASLAARLLRRVPPAGAVARLCGRLCDPCWTGGTHRQALHQNQQPPHAAGEREMTSSLLGSSPRSLSVWSVTFSHISPGPRNMLPSPSRNLRLLADSADLGWGHWGGHGHQGPNLARLTLAPKNGRPQRGDFRCQHHSHWPTIGELLEVTNGSCDFSCA